jgi:hypothetical protein
MVDRLVVLLRQSYEAKYGDGAKSVTYESSAYALGYLSSILGDSVAKSYAVMERVQAAIESME